MAEPLKELSSLPDGSQHRLNSRKRCDAKSEIFTSPFQDKLDRKWGRKTKKQNDRQTASQ
jgi:hypothetical protein